MTKYVIKTNKPLSDLDDDEMLHLLIVPARMKGAVYTAKSRKSDGFGKITPYHTLDLLHWCYLAGCAFETSLAFFQLFKADEFWDSDQEKPKDDGIMRAVMAYALKPKSPEMRARAEKMTRVLEHFSKAGVDPNGVEAKLKSGGGVDKICRRHCGTATGDTTVDVNIDKAAPLEGDNGGLDVSKDQETKP